MKEKFSNKRRKTNFKNYKDACNKCNFINCQSACNGACKRCYSTCHLKGIHFTGAMHPLLFYAPY